MRIMKVFQIYFWKWSSSGGTLGLLEGLDPGLELLSFQSYWDILKFELKMGIQT